MEQRRFRYSIDSRATELHVKDALDELIDWVDNGVINEEAVEDASLLLEPPPSLVKKKRTTVVKYESSIKKLEKPKKVPPPAIMPKYAPAWHKPKFLLSHGDAFDCDNFLPDPPSAIVQIEPVSADLLSALLNGERSVSFSEFVASPKKKAVKSTTIKTTQKARNVEQERKKSRKVVEEETPKRRRQSKPEVPTTSRKKKSVEVKKNDKQLKRTFSSDSISSSSSDDLNLSSSDEDVPIKLMAAKEEKEVSARTAVEKQLDKISESLNKKKEPKLKKKDEKAPRKPSKTTEPTVKIEKPKKVSSKKSKIYAEESTVKMETPEPEENKLKTDRPSKLQRPKRPSNEPVEKIVESLVEELVLRTVLEEPGGSASCDEDTIAALRLLRPLDIALETLQPPSSPADDSAKRKRRRDECSDSEAVAPSNPAVERRLAEIERRLEKKKRKKEKEKMKSEQFVVSQDKDLKMKLTKKPEEEVRRSKKEELKSKESDQLFVEMSSSYAKRKEKITDITQRKKKRIMDDVDESRDESPSKRREKVTAKKSHRSSVILPRTRVDEVATPESTSKSSSPESNNIFAKMTTSSDQGGLESRRVVTAEADSTQDSLDMVGDITSEKPKKNSSDINVMKRDQRSKKPSDSSTPKASTSTSPTKPAQSKGKHLKGLIDTTTTNKSTSQNPRVITTTTSSATVRKQRPSTSSAPQKPKSFDLVADILSNTKTLEKKKEVELFETEEETKEAQQKKSKLIAERQKLLTSKRDLAKDIRVPDNKEVTIGFLSDTARRIADEHIARTMVQLREGNIKPTPAHVRRADSYKSPLAQCSAPSAAASKNRNNDAGAYGSGPATPRDDTGFHEHRPGRRESREEERSSTRERDDRPTRERDDRFRQQYDRRDRDRDRQDDRRDSNRQDWRRRREDVEEKPKQRRIDAWAKPDPSGMYLPSQALIAGFGGKQPPRKASEDVSETGGSSTPKIVDYIANATVQIARERRSEEGEGMQGNKAELLTSFELALSSYKAGPNHHEKSNDNMDLEKPEEAPPAFQPPAAAAASSADFGINNPVNIAGFSLDVEEMGRLSPTKQNLMANIIQTFGCSPQPLTDKERESLGQFFTQLNLIAQDGSKLSTPAVESGSMDRFGKSGDRNEFGTIAADHQIRPPPAHRESFVADRQQNIRPARHMNDWRSGGPQTSSSFEPAVIPPSFPPAAASSSAADFDHWSSGPNRRNQNTTVGIEPSTTSFPPSFSGPPPSSSLPREAAPPAFAAAQPLNFAGSSDSLVVPNNRVFPVQTTVQHEDIPELSVFGAPAPSARAKPLISPSAPLHVDRLPRNRLQSFDQPDRREPLIGQSRAEPSGGAGMSDLMSDVEVQENLNTDSLLQLFMTLLSDSESAIVRDPVRLRQAKEFIDLLTELKQQPSCATRDVLAPILEFVFENM